MIALGAHSLTKRFFISANVISVLLLSPNFIALVFPLVKIFQLSVFLLSLTVVVFELRPHIERLSVILLLFALAILMSSLVNFVRFDVASSLVISLSYVFKISSVIVLFRLCRSRDDFYFMLRVLVWCVGLFAAHGILQVIAVASNFSTSIGELSVSGYQFVNLGFLGIYRVGLELNGLYIIRAQSFFQEPGFFAFYLLFGLLLLDHIKFATRAMPYRVLFFVFVLAMLCTMSLTGVFLMAIYIFFSRRVSFFVASVLCLLVALFSFVLVNDNPYIAKAGSLAMRLGHYELVSILSVSWQNFVFGIGMGNEVVFSEMRVNNFIVELVMYSSLLGSFLMFFVLSRAVRYGRNSNHIVFYLLLYALSTPMFWSSALLIAIYVSFRSNRYVSLANGG